jgi:hypothetical protein
MDNIDNQSIRPFPPLDPGERLPRQEMLSQDRGGLQLQREPAGWRKITRAELAAVVALPAVILVGVALGTSGASAPVAFISIGALILGLAAFALSGRHG